MMLRRHGRPISRICRRWGIGRFNNRRRGDSALRQRLGIFPEGSIVTSNFSSSSTFEPTIRNCDITDATNAVNGFQRVQSWLAKIGSYRASFECLFIVD
jgi:hypothetical protein